MSAPEIYLMRRVCAPCKKELAPKPTCDASVHGKISHTYCPDCYAAEMAKLQPKEKAAA